MNVMRKATVWQVKYNQFPICSTIQRANLLSNMKYTYVVCDKYGKSMHFSINYHFKIGPDLGSTGSISVWLAKGL